MNSNKTKLPLCWILQIVAALILAQTLFFKFTGAEESKFIFRTLGVEPWGRWMIGGLELVAVILLLLPRWAAIGGLFSVGLMAGAVFSHLTKLGIVVQGDGGLLFGLALTVLASGAGVAWLRRFELPYIGSLLRGNPQASSAGKNHEPE